MALFDLPAALFGWADDLLTSLPPAVRLTLWAALGAIVSMELYRLLSPQRRIEELKTSLQEAQRRLSQYDGELEGAWPLIGRMLRLALRRVLVVLPATIAASLPLLALILWLDSAYSREFPRPGEEIGVEAPEGYEAQWTWPFPGDLPRARILDEVGAMVADVPVAAPVPIIHKARWWNVLIGNPAGYLEDDAPVDAIGLDLPRQELHGFGPAWLRRWEVLFFPVLIVSALAFKLARRIQ